jgi:hypothetical protein
MLQSAHMKKTLPQFSRLLPLSWHLAPSRNGQPGTTSEFNHKIKEAIYAQQPGGVYRSGVNPYWTA